MIATELQLHPLDETYAAYSIKNLAGGERLPPRYWTESLGQTNQENLWTPASPYRASP